MSESMFQIDVWHFERVLAERTRGTVQRSRLYRGELLKGLHPPGVCVRRMADAETRTLPPNGAGGDRTTFGPSLAIDMVETAQEAAMRILAIDPVDESAHRALMSIYARKHRYGLAVRQYQICREVLDRELNVEPELETRQLHSGNYQAQAEGLGREAEKCQRSVRNRSLPPPPTCPVISALNKFWRD